jgi:hypothetical protein
MIDKYVWSKFGESLRFGKIIDEEMMKKLGITGVGFE